MTEKNNGSGRAVVYIRVSSKEQAESGFSLEAQKEACLRYARDNNFKVMKIFTEAGESAKTQNRTQLQKMMKYISENQNIASVIVWKFDRFARNLADQFELVKFLEDHGARVLSVTENNEESPVGKFMRNMLGAVAQYENDIKSERTIQGMMQAVKEGCWVNVAPIGYRNARDKMQRPILEPTDEKKYIQTAFTLMAEGINTQADVVKILRRMGLKKISNQSLGKLLRNPVYIGLISYNRFDEPINGLHEPIISKELFYKVQGILSGVSKAVRTRSEKNQDFPLRGYLNDFESGKKFSGGWSQGRNKKYPYYVCNVGSKTKNYKRDEVDASFKAYLGNIEIDPGILKPIEIVLRDYLKEEDKYNIQEKKRIEKYLIAIENKKQRIIDLHINNEIEMDIYRTELEKVKKEIAEIEISLSQLNKTDNFEEVMEFCKKYFLNLKFIWENADIEGKHKLLSVMFPDGLSYDGNQFRTAPNSLLLKQIRQALTCPVNYGTP